MKNFSRIINIDTWPKGPTHNQPAKGARPLDILFHGEAKIRQWICRSVKLKESAVFSPGRNWEVNW